MVKPIKGKCPEGYRYRKSYRTSSGKLVHASCVKISACNKGQIIREGYYRKPYTRKDGTKVKGTFVKPSCIKDRGKPGKGSFKIPVTKGTLGQFGYSKIKSLNVEERHKALKKAVKSLGGMSVFRKLNAVATFNKNTNPKIAASFKRDRDWVKKTFNL